MPLDPKTLADYDLTIEQAIYNAENWETQSGSPDPTMVIYPLILVVKELLARNTALDARVTALENA